MWSACEKFRRSSNGLAFVEKITFLFHPPQSHFSSLLSAATRCARISLVLGNYIYEISRKLCYRVFENEKIKLIEDNLAKPKMRVFTSSKSSELTQTRAMRKLISYLKSAAYKNRVTVTLFSAFQL